MCAMYRSMWSWWYVWQLNGGRVEVTRYMCVCVCVEGSGVGGWGDRLEKRLEQ